MLKGLKREMVYHLSRLGILYRSDLSLIRGCERDRYSQLLIKELIDKECIEEIPLDNCAGIIVTEKGYNEISQDYTHRNNEIENEYQEYVEKAIAEIEKQQLSPNSLIGDIEAEVIASNSLTLYAQVREKDNGWMPKSDKPITLAKHLYNPNAPTTISSETELSLLKRELRKSTVEHMMYCSGVVIYQERKPPILKLLEILRKEDYKDSFCWELIKRRGIFYSRQDIRDLAHEELNGYVTGRLVGILFTSHSWYYCYNTLDRNESVYPSTETPNIVAISSIINTLLPYKACKNKALIFSTGKSMIYKLVTGRKYIKRKRKTVNLSPTDGRSRRKRKPLLSGSMLSELFERAYLLEANSAGLEQIKYILHEVAYEDDVLRKIASYNPGIYKIILGNTGLSLKEEETGIETKRMVVPDIIDIWKTTKQEKPTIYICPERYVSQLQRTAGEHISTYIDINTGEEIIHDTI